MDSLYLRDVERVPLGRGRRDHTGKKGEERGEGKGNHPRGLVDVNRNVGSVFPDRRQRPPGSR